MIATLPGARAATPSPQTVPTNFPVLPTERVPSVPSGFGNLGVAVAIERSDNAKLSRDSRFSVTYAAKVTCPGDCPFLAVADDPDRGGCYADTGHMRFTTSRLNRAAENVGAKPLTVALCEAEQIRGLSGRFPLRLHGVGDCPTNQTARVVAAASADYAAKHGQPVYGYTHALGVSRDAWGAVSMLRSCHTMDEVSAAHDAGFASALVVPEHESPRAVPLGEGFVGVPCPQQTASARGKETTCSDCRLCFDDARLRSKKQVILFAGHGPSGVIRKVARTIAAASSRAGTGSGKRTELPVLQGAGGPK